MDGVFNCNYRTEDEERPMFSLFYFAITRCVKIDILVFLIKNGVPVTDYDIGLMQGYSYGNIDIGTIVELRKKVYFEDIKEPCEY